MRMIILCLAAALAARSDNILAQTPRQLSVTRELRIDGVASDLVEIGDISIARDGTVAIAQAPDKLVRVFDAKGKPIRTIGRDGAGPGEFRWVSRVGWMADTLWAYDARLNRLSFFAGDKLLRTVSAPSSARPGTGTTAGLPLFRGAFPRSLLPDGSMIAEVGIPSGPSEAAYSGNRRIIVHLGADGTIRRMLANVELPDYGISASSGTSMSYARQPFQNIPLFDIAEDGRRIASVSAALDGKDKGTFSVSVIDANGATLFSRRHAFTSVPLSKRAADSAMSADLEKIRERQQMSVELAAAYRKQVVIPPLYPPFRFVLAGRDQTLWIALRRTAKGSPYLVLDGKGAIIGEVILPPGAEVVRAQADMVWAREKDADDVESVVRYRIGS